MELSEILSEDELNQIPQGIVAKLESACNKYISDYEARGDKRFNNLVEAVSGQFNDVVNAAVKKKVDSMTNNTMNGKLMEALSKVASALTECGYKTVNERKLEQRLALVDEQLKKLIVERKLIQKEKGIENLKKQLWQETMGYTPDKQNEVIAQFVPDKHDPNSSVAGADLNRETIIKFVTQGPDEINVPTAGGEIKSQEMISTSDLNETVDELLKSDVLKNGVETFMTQAKQKPAGVSYGTNTNIHKQFAKKPSVKQESKFGNASPAFEALGKGLSDTKVFNSPTVTKEMLSKPTALGTDYPDDVADVMNLMGDFGAFM